jgi:hypothetical protein
VAIKISQFNSLPVVDGTIIVPVVDPSPSNTSLRTTVADLQTFILNGNSATATKLFQSVNINGVAFDGSAAVIVTADASTLTVTTLNSTVVGSSLTSVGTLTNLTVTNTISGTVTNGVVTSGSYDNPSWITALAGTKVTNAVLTTDTGTVTNTMLAGSIANSKLTNNSVTFNGVTVALGASGSITTALAAATTSTLGGVIVGSGINVLDGTISIYDASTTTKGLVLIPAVGTSGITNSSGTISIAIASNSQLGGVKIGAGISVGVDGTLTGPTRKFHGFSVDANSNLIYSTTEDTTINFQSSTGADLYEDVDLGTNEYAYSMDAGGNLIVTYS